MYVSFQNGSFALLLDLVLDLTLSLVDHFLNAGGVDSSVGNKLFKGNSCHLTSCGVKAGKSDSLGCIVDNKVNACEGFKCPDVASLTSDNTTLHIVIGQGDNGNRSFGNLVCGTFCNSK